jgi:hypothetical protein
MGIEPPARPDMAISLPADILAIPARHEALEEFELSPQ